MIKNKKNEDSENDLEDESSNNIGKNYLNAESSSILEKHDISMKNNEKSNSKRKEEDLFENESYDFDNENSLLHRRADVSMKMNSFMHYTSENDSRSSISIEPNSLDNDTVVSPEESELTPTVGSQRNLSDLSWFGNWLQ